MSRRAERLEELDGSRDNEDPPLQHRVRDEHRAQTQAQQKRGIGRGGGVNHEISSGLDQALRGNTVSTRTMKACSSVM